MGESRYPPMTNMENTLQRINSQCISLSKDIEQRNNKILTELVNIFVEEMKRRDPLFKTLYRRIFYGGSYYDELKVGQPDEYDLDLLMVLPKQVRYDLSQFPKHPGFMQLKIHNPELLGDQFQRKLMKEDFLSADKLRRWMEGLVTTVLSMFKSQNGYYELKAGGYLLRGKMRKSGPAMTLQVTNTYEKILLDIDLVPCFEFDFDRLPHGNWRKNPVPSKPTFFIVPKRPKDLGNLPDICWRLSFQEQERKLILNKRNLKPALKLLKRLRDVLGHDSIASYYIKTVFLWSNEKHGETYWNATLTDVFIKMLKVYIEYLESGKIAYFWNSQLNLLPTDQRTGDIKNQLRRIFNSIERNRATNPQVVCEYLNCNPN